ncbi:MAG: aminomethyltransferase family protein [Ardenticatenaceae bacterium]
MSGRIRPETELASRHEALGAVLEPWGGVGTAYDYALQSTEDEHDAIRERVGVFDVSGLHKAWVTGPDAAAVLDHMCVRDVARMVDGQGGYTPVLTEEGTVTDDAIIYRYSADRFLYVNGTGKSEEMAKLSMEGMACQWENDDSIQDLAVQGPDSMRLINSLISDDISRMRFYRFIETTFQGRDVMISRTGFTGEVGYEIYCDRADVCFIWDTLLKEGQNYKIMATGFDCLDKVRIESALLFYPYDMDESHSIHEAGLAWSLPKNKVADYRGSAMVEVSRGQEKSKIVGVVVDHHDICSEDALLYVNGQEVGKITSPAWSHRMDQSLALARVDTEHASVGTTYDVIGGGMNTTAVNTSIPFFDPKKKRLRARPKK